MRHDPSNDELIYQVTAAVTAPDAGAEVFADVRFRRYDVSSLNVRLNVLGDDRYHRIRVYSQLSHPHWNYYWLYAKAPETLDVELLGIRGISSEGGAGDEIRVVVPEVTAVQIGITSQALTADVRHSVSVQLAPSGIVQQPASVLFKGNGEIEREAITEGEVLVSTQRGTWRVRDFYDSGQEEEFGNRVTKLIQRAGISGDLTIRDGESLAEANEAVQQCVTDICTLLSLCYRVRVDFYQISYWRYPQDAPPSECILRRKLSHLARRSRERDELINFRDLVNGGLDSLYRVYRELPRKEELSRGILFLASAYANNSLEASYFMTFSALECVVGAAEGKVTYALGSARWERLEQRLKNTIADFLSLEVADTAERDELLLLLKEKLPEVRRVSIRRRLVTLCERLNVTTTDLWPPSIGFNDGFARATSARNSLFHAAVCDSPDDMNDDMVRLRVLTERLALRLLLWPDDKIWRWYDQDLRWTNREE